MKTTALSPLPPPSVSDFFRLTDGLPGNTQAIALLQTRRETATRGSVARDCEKWQRRIEGFSTLRDRDLGRTLIDILRVLKNNSKNDRRKKVCSQWINHVKEVCDVR